MPDIPPWAAAVQQLSDGRWQPLLIAADPVPSEAQARELSEYLCRQLDARLRDVGRQLDAATCADAAAPVPPVVFTDPDPLRPTEGDAR